MNRYAGKCYKCGKWVLAKEGLAVIPRGKETVFKVQHHECVGNLSLLEEIKRQSQGEQ